MQPSHIGEYILLREIARGGQGVVYLAKHPQLLNRAAIKLLLDPSDAVRFKQEARILSQVRHPNLVQVIDFNQTGQYPYMVMEYIDGWDLKTYLTNTRPSLPHILDIIKTIGQAVSYLHQYKIVHRDIKPANILIEKETLRPVLADLGLAKKNAAPGNYSLSMGSIATRVTESGEILGTPMFMAPEQVSSTMGKIGPWTDVYGLGVTLFFALTGRGPYVADNGLAMFVKLQDDDLPPQPIDVNPEVPQYLNDAIWMAIQKSPETRPQSIEQFVAMLDKPKTMPARRRLWMPITAGALGFGGLVAYFMSLGASPRKARELAQEELQVAPLTTPINIAPTTSMMPIETIPIADPRFNDRVRRAVELGRDGQYEASIAACDALIRDYPDAHVVYWARANSYYRLGIQLLNEGQNEAGRNALQECLEDVELTLRIAPRSDTTLEVVRALKEQAEIRLSESSRRFHRY